MCARVQYCAGAEGEASEPVRASCTPRRKPVVGSVKAARFAVLEPPLHVAVLRSVSVGVKSVAVATRQLRVSDAASRRRPRPCTTILRVGVPQSAVGSLHT